MTSNLNIIKTDIGWFFFDSVDFKSNAYESFVAMMKERFYDNDYPFGKVEFCTCRFGFGKRADNCIIREEVAMDIHFAELNKFVTDNQHFITDFEIVSTVKPEPSNENYMQFPNPEEISHKCFNILCLKELMFEKFNYEGFMGDEGINFDYLDLFDMLNSLEQNNCHQIYDIDSEVKLFATEILLGKYPNIRLTEKEKQLIDQIRSRGEIKYHDIYLSRFVHLNVFFWPAKGYNYIYIHNDLPPEKHRLFRDVVLNRLDPKLNYLEFVGHASLVSPGEVIPIGPSSQPLLDIEEIPVYNSEEDFRLSSHRDMVFFHLSELIEFFKIEFEKTYTEYICDTYILFEGNKVVDAGRGAGDEGFLRFVKDMCNKFSDMDKYTVSFYHTSIHDHRNMDYNIRHREYDEIPNRLEWISAKLKYSFPLDNLRTLFTSGNSLSADISETFVLFTELYHK